MAWLLSVVLGTLTLSGIFAAIVIYWDEIVVTVKRWFGKV